MGSTGIHAIARRSYRKARREAKRVVERLKGYPPTVGFPWYDSQWLSSYVRVTRYLATHRPEVLPVFESRLAVLRTSAAFEPVEIPRLFDDDVMSQIREAIASHRPEQYETHELGHFGRDVVHDVPLFLKLQADVVDRVSEIVGEPLEVSYNFLSLYRSDGVCPVHMDAPDAKWTLDICIDQSREWPLHVGPVVPWPEDWQPSPSSGWAEGIRGSMPFHEYRLAPGDAVVFAGSSQWHYRSPMADAGPEDFCTLLFFHFIPAGTSDLVRAARWGSAFGVPELAHL